MQSDAKRSRGPDLPAICDLQGDFQKLQGEPILLLPTFLMVSKSWKEFSRHKEQGAFLVLQGKEQGGFLVLQGRAALELCHAEVGARGQAEPNAGRDRR